MLIKQDLKLLKELLHDEVVSEITSSTEELDARIRLSRMDLSQRISQIEKHLKKIDANILRLKKDISTNIKVSDEGIVEL
jgi:cob(I)alamin adenosyltransferase